MHKSLMIISILITVLLTTFGCSDANANTGASGTADDPILVYNAQDLNNVRNNLNVHYRQMADIDLVTYANWDPIGTSTNPFRGTYDGNGFSISNMTITVAAEDLTNAVGLFGTVTSNNIQPFDDAGLHNITLIDATIAQEAVRDVADPYQGDIGLLAGDITNTSIENCTITGGTINVPNHMRVGGIIGEIGQSCSISQSSAQNLNLTAHSYLGGIVGVLHGQEISESFATGTLISTETRNYSGYGAHTGGIAGQVGYHSIITDSYFIGDLTGAAGYIGGLVGRLYGSPDPSTTELVNSYYVGNFTFPTSTVEYGGLIGYIQTLSNPNADLDDLLYLADFPESVSPQAADSDEGLSTYDMQEVTNSDHLKNQSTLANDYTIAWDFTNTWALDTSINDGYPYLINNPPTQVD